MNQERYGLTLCWTPTVLNPADDFTWDEPKKVVLTK
jgi:long-subunit acyl-CoA synthetase (AMP-forming)